MPRVNCLGCNNLKFFPKGVEKCKHPDIGEKVVEHGLNERPNWCPYGVLLSIGAMRETTDALYMKVLPMAKQRMLDCMKEKGLSWKGEDPSVLLLRATKKWQGITMSDVECGGLTVESVPLLADMMNYCAMMIDVLTKEETGEV